MREVYGDKLINRYINKALEFNEDNITYETILEEEALNNKAGKKKKKDIKPYYLRFPWKSQENIDKWLEYLEEDIKKNHPNWSEDKVRVELGILEMLSSLSEMNIISESMKK